MLTNMANSSELEKLHMPLGDLNAKSQINHAEVERLRRELDAATKEMVKVDKSYRAQLIHYARADCLQLANMMHQKLPKELRELIYEYLCVEPDRPILVGPYYHFRKYDRRLDDNPPVDDDNPQHHDGIHDYNNIESTGLSRQQQDDIERDIEDIHFDDETVVLPDGRIKTVHSYRPPSDMVLPSSHFLNPRYVGPVISREIQEMYYTRNIFSICNVECAIDRFLYRHSGYSMKKCAPDGTPPRIHEDLRLEPLFFPFQYVQRLQIRVKCEQFFENMPRAAAENEKYMYEQHFLRFTEDYLKPLLKLVDSHSKHRSKHKLEIEFVIMTELPSGWLTTPNLSQVYNRHFINILEAIRSSVYTVSHDCLDSTVKITHYDENVSIFPRDITGWFALTKEQWEHEKLVNAHRPHAPGSYLAPRFVPPGSLISGFHERDMDRLLLERWGVDSVKDTKAKHPTKEGKYWPKGYISEAWQIWYEDYDADQV